jgi:hypothetical protein
MPALFGSFTPVKVTLDGRNCGKTLPHRSNLF